MALSTDHLLLSPDSPIDLQVHTVHSDGTWTPEALIDHLVSEGFGLVAITDHDRVDTVESLQALAREKGLPVLVATEMSTTWQGQATDVLCFGFDPAKGNLYALTQELLNRQRENTVKVCDSLHRSGFDPLPADEIDAVLASPSAAHPHSLMALLLRHGYGADEDAVWNFLEAAGVRFVTNDLASVVDAAHADGGVCLIAHPGRGGGFAKFDTSMLDDLRQTVPIDGIEVYYPRHSPEQVAMFRDYADAHGLLTSSGSDSHGVDKLPIKYRAELSRALLERVGIRLSVL